MSSVIARGLDVPRVQHVLHYDVARSPQLYLHRSGRTARAGASGTAVSIVSPEDVFHHEQICRAQGIGSFPTYRLDLEMTIALRERVSLAKQIFTDAFVTLQDSKQKCWLDDISRGSDLQLDDYAQEEKIQEENRGSGRRNQKEKRNKLKALLNNPVEKSVQRHPQRKRGAFIVVAK